MDCSPPGSSVHGILQARILEWIAIPFSKGSSWPGIEPVSPALQADSLPTEPPGKCPWVCVRQWGQIWPMGPRWFVEPCIRFMEGQITSKKTQGVGNSALINTEAGLNKQEFSGRTARGLQVYLSRRSRFKFQSCHLLAVWHKTSYCISLSLGLLICKVDIITLLVACSIIITFWINMSH